MSEVWQLTVGLPDSVLLYVELFDFQIQGRPRNSEVGSRSIWPSNFSLTFRKSRFDESLLIIMGNRPAPIAQVFGREAGIVKPALIEEVGGAVRTSRPRERWDRVNYKANVLRLRACSEPFATDAIA